MSVQHELRSDEFRREICDFLDHGLSDAIREGGRKTTSVFSPFEVAMAFQRALHTRGWGAAAWPVEYGGAGWNLDQQRIFQEECSARELPLLLPNALQMVGPVVMKFGTQEQKERYLPRIVSGEDYWAQGYSEPGAGSDLAALKCRADRDGDVYVINGSKIWTTYAHHANRMFMLVRTDFDCKPQRGITFLLLDSLDLPGMSVREITGLDGVSEQCEVFFDDVRVPVGARLGEENDGWSVAKYLLVHERGSSVGVGMMIEAELLRVKRLAAELADGMGGCVVDDAAFQRRFAELWVEGQTVFALVDKLSRIDMSSPEAGHYSSLIKIAWTETLQRVCSFAVDVCGTVSLPLQLQALEVGSDIAPLGPPEALTVMPKYLNHHAASIYGGSNEIQREIIAKAILSD